MKGKCRNGMTSPKQHLPRQGVEDHNLLIICWKPTQEWPYSYNIEMSNERSQHENSIDIDWNSKLETTGLMSLVGEIWAVV